MVADYARAYLDVMLSYSSSATSSPGEWSTVIRWLEGFDPRADKKPKRGTPYDRQFRPKLLRQAIASALAGAAPCVA